MISLPSVSELYINGGSTRWHLNSSSLTVYLFSFFGWKREKAEQLTNRDIVDDSNGEANTVRGPSMTYCCSKFYVVWGTTLLIKPAITASYSYL